MIQIERGNAWARIAHVDTDAEWRWLYEYLTVEQPGFVMAGGRPKRVVSRQCLLDRQYRFPGGLTSAIVRGGRGAGFEVCVTDSRPPISAIFPAGTPCAGEVSARFPWLRDYQAAGVASMLAARQGILRAATGSGKTEIAIVLTQMVPGTWLFLAHRNNLASQAAERFEARTGEVAGRFWQGHSTAGRVTFATFQTMHRALGGGHAAAKALLQNAIGLIVDEAHVVAAPTQRQVALACAASWRFGLSATPLDRSDKMSMLVVAAIGGGVVHEVHAQGLIEQGYVAKPEILLLPCRQEWADKGRQSKYATVYRDLVVRSKQRNSLVIAAARAAKKPTMVFVQHIAHGEALTRELAATGLRAAFVDGSVPAPLRERAIAALRDESLDVCVATVVFAEGVDVPGLASVVVASGGKSVIQALQRIGRGMRRAAGKDTFEVWDIADNGNKWLEAHARARAKAYQREGHEVRVGTPDHSEALP